MLTPNAETAPISILFVPEQNAPITINFFAANNTFSVINVLVLYII